MAEYNSGRSKVEDILIDQLKELRFIRDEQPSDEPKESFLANEEIWIRVMNDNAGVDTIVVFLECELI